MVIYAESKSHKHLLFHSGVRNLLNAYGKYIIWSNNLDMNKEEKQYAFNDCYF